MDRNDMLDQMCDDKDAQEALDDLEIHLMEEDVRKELRRFLDS